MTTYTTTKRFATTLVLAALLVLAVAPGAMAADGSTEPRGWERTAQATGQPDGGQVSQTTSTSPQFAPRGWEATSVATGGSPRVAGDPEPVTPPVTPSSSPTLFTIIGLLAAAALAIGAARMLRSSGRPHGVA